MGSKANEQRVQRVPAWQVYASLTKRPRCVACGRSLVIAVRMPLKIRRGLGGHPGTATSTGITFDTRPQLA
jgi:hypothetical protein